ncbi:MAG: hypothetical protein K0R26_1595 [Bacteroidota bacterium]|jgi:hypothetical protein|nr:hypothetical protein [Bacteroidota bacterium]
MGISFSGFSQDETPGKQKFNNFKADSSFAFFTRYHHDVARAQIVSLKNGALLVRLKTNNHTIQRLKSAGNIDLATQVQRETDLNNKMMMKAYRNEFKFCPVYFFMSDASDSVKNKRLESIFVDSNLVPDPAIVCNASFYLIAEQGFIRESSLGLVPETKAGEARDYGTETKEVAIVVKNRYFIQLHKPFPYFQTGYHLKNFPDYVKRFNLQLNSFYNKNSGYVIPPEIKEYVY